MAKKLPLGKCLAGSGRMIAVRDNLTDAERVEILKQQIKTMTETVAMLQARMNKEQVATSSPVNKDGLPIGLTCIGITEKSAFTFFLTVRENSYSIGNKEYGSLSAAAEAVSGVRRSGWVFWKLPDGRTLKEVYKKR